MNYKEKLLDPRWQKKRLEILSRDEFTCQSCLDKTKTLHVHHVDYLPKTEPWEYDNAYLITLCEDCHKDIKDYRPQLESNIISEIRLKLKTVSEIETAYNVLQEYDVNSLFLMLHMLQNRKEEVMIYLQNKVMEL